MTVEEYLRAQCTRRMEQLKRHMDGLIDSFESEAKKARTVLKDIGANANAADEGSSSAVVEDTEAASAEADASDEFALVAITGLFAGRVYKFRPNAVQTQWSIGRADDNDVCLAGDDEVSSNHAQISFAGKQFKLQDLGSTNGTFASNGLVSAAKLKRRKNHALKVDHLVTFGSSTFKWAYTDDAEKLADPALPPAPQSAPTPAPTSSPTSVMPPTALTQSKSLSSTLDRRCEVLSNDDLVTHLLSVLFSYQHDVECLAGRSRSSFSTGDMAVTLCVQRSGSSRELSSLIEELPSYELTDLITNTAAVCHTWHHATREATRMLQGSGRRLAVRVHCFRPPVQRVRSPLTTDMLHALDARNELIALDADWAMGALEGSPRVGRRARRRG